MSFKISTHEEEFISTVRATIKSGDIIRTQITPDNLKQVFGKWVDMLGREIAGVAEDDYALLFFADIMHDGTVSTHANLPAELLHKNGPTDRFESDFMVQYLPDKTLSSETQAVLNAGRALWKTYFSQTDVHSVRDEFKLNRPDVAWYQIRNALRKRNESGDTITVSFAPFEAAYSALSDKLRPQVFELGFLP